MRKESTIENYQQFVAEVETGLEFFLATPKEIWKDAALKYVDGYAAEELRRLVNLETRRKHGIFFTHNDLAKKVLSKLKPILNKESFVYDPACGVGNLLIAVADFAKDLSLKLGIKENLAGTDIHHEFVDAARLRLCINDLVNKTGKINFINDRISGNLTVADGLQKNNFYERASHIFVNPPFNLIDSDDEIRWANGKVSAAAVFIDKIIQNVNPRTSILAILPDVLRSGSRYGKWRSMVKSSCEIESVILLGQFDKYADVDVFAYKLKKKEKQSLLPMNKKSSSKPSNTNRVLEDLFDVCVGPVVDNRDPHKGKSLGYLKSKGLAGWGEEKKSTHTRKFSGKSFQGPFVVVKRTSRRGDSHRAIATIINISSSVYVDNHLIILKPKSGKISTCLKVLKILKNKKTDDWINRQIRCRHLTVKLVAQIPMASK